MDYYKKSAENIWLFEKKSLSFCVGFLRPSKQLLMMYMLATSQAANSLRTIAV